MEETKDRFFVIDSNGMPQLIFLTHSPDKGSQRKIGYTLYYDTGFTEDDEAEIQKLLTEDESLADLVATE